MVANNNWETNWRSSRVICFVIIKSKRGPSITRKGQDIRAEDERFTIRKMQKCKCLIGGGRVEDKDLHVWKYRLKIAEVKGRGLGVRNSWLGDLGLKDLRLSD